MALMKSRLLSVFLAFKVGIFLATRELRRTNIWTTVLVISIMVLTFLNLIVVTGILVGLIEGAVKANKNLYLGDVFITNLSEKPFIENDRPIIDSLRNDPTVEQFTVRYLVGSKLEANYKNIRDFNDIRDNAAGQLAGVDPLSEDQFSHLSKYVIEGSYLAPDDVDQVLIGANLLYKYTPIDSSDLRALKNVEVGSKIRVIVDGHAREMTIKGVIKSKVDSFDLRVFIPYKQFQKITGRLDEYPNEIAVRLNASSSSSLIAAQAMQNKLISEGGGKVARIQTFEEAEPKFIKDIQNTFAILGNLIGSIGLAVASITIFIIIYVNAITRRRYIGILKGIGIEGKAIEIAYMFQAVFYAICGMIVGNIIVFFILKPYFDAHPINFPFSDGILVVTYTGALWRVGVLFITTLIAGFIPARLVVKQNTLDAILGR